MASLSTADLPTAEVSDIKVEPPVVYDGIVIEPPPDDSFMDPAGYFSQKLFDLEMRVVYPRSWVFVGDLSQLRSPGDYVTETIGTEPVMVVRGRDGELRAFVNVCPHRASTLVEGSGNCGRALVCPYHGWTFHLDGRLAATPHPRGFVEPVDRSAYGLREVRVDVWLQFVFVNVSGDAPPLHEWLYPAPEQFARHNLEAATRVYELDDEVNANWKVMMDNAFCDYHLEFVHENTLGRFADASTLQEEIWDYTGRLTSQWSDEQLARTDVLPALAAANSYGSVAFGVFPNWFIAAFPNGGCSLMWWNPISLDRSRARVWNYSPDPGADARADFEMLKAVQAEDYAICEKVQRGLRSRSYRPGPQHYLELRVRGHQQRLMKMLADAIRRGEG